MKTLILARHAKSDWNQANQTDFDRTLNQRGLRDATMMGIRLKNKELNIEKIISSAAIRASLTASLIAKEIDYTESNIRFLKELYHASPQTIEAQIFAIDNTIQYAMIVCHNPGITHFANQQCGHFTDNIPTCGIVAFQIQTENWEQYSLADKKLLFYDFPKNT